MKLLLVYNLEMLLMSRSKSLCCLGYVLDDREIRAQFPTGASTLALGAHTASHSMCTRGCFLQG